MTKHKTPYANHIRGTLKMPEPQKRPAPNLGGMPTADPNPNKQGEPINNAGVPADAHKGRKV